MFIGQIYDINFDNANILLKTFVNNFLNKNFEA